MPGVVATGRPGIPLDFSMRPGRSPECKTCFQSDSGFADSKTGPSAKRRVEVLRAKQYNRGEIQQLHYGAHTFC